MAIWIGLGIVVMSLVFGCGRRKSVVMLPAGNNATIVVAAHNDTLHPPAAPTPRNGTISDRIRQYGVIARKCHVPFFQAAGVSYPPARVVLVGLKAEQALEVYAAGKTGPFRFIRAYPILAESGTLGPKLHEGDNQVPEGIYGITLLNPNSDYHVSMEVSYPNDLDRATARRERRTHLGEAIMIHGNACSAGCLAMGDGTAEDLFVLAHDTGISHLKVILSPVDFRRHTLPKDMPPQPTWVGDLYAKIQQELQTLPLPPAAQR